MEETHNDNTIKPDDANSKIGQDEANDNQEAVNQNTETVNLDR